MDKVIAEMPFTDEATKTLLQEIADKKNKLTNQEWNHRLGVLLTCVLTIVTVIHLGFYFFSDANASIGDRYEFLSQDVLTFWFFLGLLSSFMWMKIAKTKCDKYEQEYERLRMEIVAKNDDLWKQEEAWQNRHQVFQLMKEIYDINLFYESK